MNVPVKGLKFSPNKISAGLKQKVNFVWKENVAHNIVFDKTHKSPTQNKGTWTTSFDKAGSYKFKCTLHPGMEGPLTKPLAAHKNIAHIGVPVAVVILLLWQITS